MSLQIPEGATLDERMGNTPTVPEWLYSSLPQPLLAGCSAFVSEREKDVFLTASLCVLSACFPTVSGIYDQRRVWGNLYGFVVAPAASGKGAATWGKQLGFAYHQAQVKESREKRTEYIQNVSDSKSRKGKGPDLAEPPFRQLFIPGNTSASCLMQSLSENEERGIVFETEADALTTALQQREWGNFSDTLRKAFHHEPVSLQRKTNREFIELEKPQLSVFLAGTPNQLFRLIPSAEDGLFSRFLYYSYRVNSEWRDVSPNRSLQPLDSIFNELGSNICTAMLSLEEFGKIEFYLSDTQWKLLNDTFDGWLSEVSEVELEEAVSVVKRMGMIAFRLAMLLSILRQLESGNRFEVLLACQNKDLMIALELSKIYLVHALLVLEELPKPTQTQRGAFNARKNLLNDLPESFSLQEAYALGSGVYQMKLRTVRNHLKNFVKEGFLWQPAHGKYTKR